VARRAQVIGVSSARPDGATSVAVALSAQFCAQARTLVVDLNPVQPELGALLDLDGPLNLHHVAHAFQLGCVRSSDLERSLSWRDGVACVAGVAHPDQGAEITTPFVSALLATASEMFEVIVLDLGRLRANLVGADAVDQLIWVVQPSPLGLAAFDRTWRVLDADAVPWMDKLAPVLNRVDEVTMSDTASYLKVQTGLAPIGTLPECRDLWRRIEYTHSLDGLLAPLEDGRRYVQTHGAGALAYRQELARLTANLPAQLEARSA